MTLSDGTVIPKPKNLIEVKNEELIRIPIFDKVYEIDGELYYKIKGDDTPRKMKDYKVEDFN